MTRELEREIRHRPWWPDTDIVHFGLLATAGNWLLWTEHDTPLASMLCVALCIASMTVRWWQQARLDAADEAPAHAGVGAEVLR